MLCSRKVLSVKVLVSTLFVVIVGSPVLGQTCQLTSVKQSDPPSAVLDIVQNGSVLVLTENYDTQDPDFIAFICLDQDEGNSPTCEAVLPDDEGAMIMEAYPNRTEPKLWNR